MHTSQLKQNIADNNNCEGSMSPAEEQLRKSIKIERPNIEITHTEPSLLKSSKNTDQVLKRTVS